MAFATAQQINAGVILMSEPNRNTVRNRIDWIKDEELDTVIIIMDNKFAVRNSGHGHSYTYVKTSNYVVYNCYASGNRDIEEMETMLDEIAEKIRRDQEKAIIVGDFNAKSSQWSRDQTDARGRLMMEWIAENNLSVLNQGDRPTFRRGEYTSTLDLTLATEQICTKITEWEVSDLESLSDHSYIIFKIDEAEKPVPIRLGTEGWQLRKLDRQRLEETLSEEHGEESETSPEAFTCLLRQICDRTMPKRRSFTKRLPVYWWNDTIAELRRDCIRLRRAHTRRTRRNDDEENQRLWEQYKTSKKRLQNEIKRAKSDSWRIIREKVDSDIWGDGYKIVMKRLVGYPRVQMSIETMERAVEHLFPVHAQFEFTSDTTPAFQEFNADELQIAAGKLKNNRAPGPGGIPPEIIKEFARRKPEYTLGVYNNLAGGLSFPAAWKRAKLLLLRKGDKPLDDPATYRPICLLDVEGKLYEQLLLIRLNRELAKSGGLSDRQFGFREGRQTTDAIQAIINIAREASEYSHSHRRLCAVITLDVRNAFNSASWKRILSELRRRNVDESLLGVIASYLSNREIILEAENTIRTKQINSGVPQGSVLGPTLWNVQYDSLLRMEQPEGATLIGFADDIAAVIVAKGEENLMTTANRVLLRVMNWMEEMGLTLAPEKTEAVLLTTRRNVSPISFRLQHVNISLSSAIKYLGIWLDTKLTFAEQVNRVTKKADKTAAALSRLMPNIGGPGSSKRRLLSSVVHSQLLYAAPVWSTAANNKKLLAKLTTVQRRMAIRVCCAYRTVSADAVGILADVPPIELLILERTEKYRGIEAATAKANLMQRWQTKWEQSTKGRWTYRLIPNLQIWINRRHKEIDYFLAQALSGHGCFRAYLYKRNRAESPNCVYCNAEDNVEHTLFVCNRWNAFRLEYELKTSRLFDIENTMENLIGAEEQWRTAYATIRSIIETKEREERSRRQ